MHVKTRPLPGMRSQDALALGGGDSSTHAAGCLLELFQGAGGSAWHFACEPPGDDVPEWLKEAECMAPSSGRPPQRLEQVRADDDADGCGSRAEAPAGSGAQAAAAFDVQSWVDALPVGTSAKEALARLKVKALPAGFDQRGLIAALVAREAATAVAGVIMLKTIPIKGIGGFAARDFRRGECILAESPLLAWTLQPGQPVSHAALQSRVDALPPQDREAFYALCQNAEHGDAKHAYGIWLSNAFPTDGTNAGRRRAPHAEVGLRSAAVFRYYCRLNHACSPNVHGAWNAGRQRQTMYALRDIKQGEELCVSYLGRSDQTRHERSTELYESFGFVCACATCTRTGEALRRSDERRSRMQALRTEIQSAVSVDEFRQNVAQTLGAGHGCGSAQALELLMREAATSRQGMQTLRRMRKQWLDTGLALIEERLELMNQEGEGALAWDTLECASRHCKSMGDQRLVEHYGARAAECARLALGEQSEEFETCSALAAHGDVATRGSGA